MNLGYRVLVIARWEVIRQGLGAMLDSIGEVRNWTTVGPFDARIDGQLDADIAIIAPTSGAAAEDYAAAQGLRFPRKLLLVPSINADDIELAMAAGADSYGFLQDVTAASLRTALSRTLEGHMNLPPRLASYLLDRARSDDRTAVLRATSLTPREREVLTLLIEGLSNQEIATRLGISIHGAKRHVSSILSKVDSPSRTHLVSTALQSGILRSA
jgi:two-component system nitrate/nitrite response regulator NarL